MIVRGYISNEGCNYRILCTTNRKSCTNSTSKTSHLNWDIWISFWRISNGLLETTWLMSTFSYMRCFVTCASMMPSVWTPLQHCKLIVTGQYNNLVLVVDFLVKRKALLWIISFWTLELKAFQLSRSIWNLQTSSNPQYSAKRP